ncbi:hypothetical protein [Phenylobacterium sp.]
MTDTPFRDSPRPAVRYEIRWSRVLELAAVSASLFALVRLLF